MQNWKCVNVVLTFAYSEIKWHSLFKILWGPYELNGIWCCSYMDPSPRGLHRLTCNTHTHDTEPIWNDDVKWDTLTQFVSTVPVGRKPCISMLSVCFPNGSYFWTPLNFLQILSQWKVLKTACHLWQHLCCQKYIGWRVVASIWINEHLILHGFTPSLKTEKSLLSTGKTAGLRIIN